MHEILKLSFKNKSKNYIPILTMFQMMKTMYDTHTIITLFALKIIFGFCHMGKIYNK
jgi:hypothetical protein